MTKEEAQQELGRLHAVDQQQRYASMDVRVYRDMVETRAAGKEWPPKPVPSNTEWPDMMFAEPLTFFMPWFAWHPVRTWDRRWRWLCWVERRLLHKKPHLDGPLMEWWQYRHRRAAA